MTGTSLPRVPEGLRDLMKVFTKDVLREKPENLYEFSANYFDGIVSEKMPQSMRKYEPVQSYEAIMKNRIRQQVPLSLVFNIIPETLTELIKQFIKAVLKESPENIYIFAKEYFHQLSISKTTQNNKSTKYTTYEKYLEGKENVRYAPKVTCECGRVLSASAQGVSPNEKIGKTGTLIIDKDSEHEGSRNGNYLRAVCIIQKHFRQYLKRKNAIKTYNGQEYVTAIYVIQRQVRRYLTRKRIAKAKHIDQQQSKNINQRHDSATYLRAVYVIQRHYRLYRKRQQKRLKNDTVSLTAAAFIIQRTFRRLIRARRAKKHTAAALDQCDEVNDNASEAGSYTSASTALLSTESAGEHMEFGGNFEESAHQQTIKEDEEVENDYVNFDEKRFEETVKNDDQSINPKMWDSYTGDDKEPDTSSIHIKRVSQENEVDRMDGGEFDRSKPQNKQTNPKNAKGMLPGGDRFELDVQDQKMFDKESVHSMNKLNNLQSTEDNIKHLSKSTPTQDDQEAEDDDSKGQQISDHVASSVIEGLDKESPQKGREKRNIDDPIVEQSGKESSKLVEVQLETEQQKRGNEKVTSAETVIVDEKSETINDLPAIHKAENKSEELEIKVDTTEGETVYKIENSKISDNQLKISSTKENSEEKVIEIETTKEEIVNKSDKSKSHDDHSEIQKIENEFVTETTKEIIVNKDPELESIEDQLAIEKKGNEFDNDIKESVNGAKQKENDEQISAKLGNKIEKLESIDVEPEMLTEQAKVVEDIFIKKDIGQTTTAKPEHSIHKPTNASTDIIEGEYKRDKRTGTEVEKQFDDLEGKIHEQSNAREQNDTQIEKLEPSDEKIENVIYESTVTKMENIVEEAILVEMAINKISNKEENIQGKFEEILNNENKGSDQSVKEVQIEINGRPFAIAETESPKTEPEFEESSGIELEGTLIAPKDIESSEEKLEDKDEQVTPDHKEKHSDESIITKIETTPIESAYVKPENEVGTECSERDENKGDSQAINKKINSAEPSTDHMETEPPLITIENQFDESTTKILGNDVASASIEKTDSTDDVPNDVKLFGAPIIIKKIDRVSKEAKSTVPEPSLLEHIEPMDSKADVELFVAPIVIRTDLADEDEVTKEAKRAVLEVHELMDSKDDKPDEVTLFGAPITIKNDRIDDNENTKEANSTEPEPSVVESHEPLIKKIETITESLDTAQTVNKDEDSTKPITEDEKSNIEVKIQGDEPIIKPEIKPTNELTTDRMESKDDDPTMELMAEIINKLNIEPVEPIENDAIKRDSETDASKNDEEPQPLVRIEEEDDESVKTIERSMDEPTVVQPERNFSEPTNEPTNEPIIKQIRNTKVESPDVKLENNAQEQKNKDDESVNQKILNASDEPTIARIENEVKVIFGIENGSESGAMPTDIEPIAPSEDFKMPIELTTEVVDPVDDSKHEIDKRSTDTRQDSVNPLDSQIIASNELPSDEQPVDTKLEKDSSLLKSNKLIGTQNFTKTTNEFDSNTKKLSKEKHIGSSLESGRLVPTPIAELQLKSFKPPADTAPWYEPVAEYNISEANENNKEIATAKIDETRAKDQKTTQDAQDHDFPTNITLERGPRYLTGDEITPIKEPKTKNSISFFISFDSDDEKQTFKVPKKFLRKTKAGTQKPNAKQTNNVQNINKDDNLEEESYPELADELDIEISENDFQQFAASKLQTIPEVNESDSSNDLRYTNRIVGQESEQSVREVKENASLNTTEIIMEQFTELKTEVSLRGEDVDKETISTENKNHNAAVIIQNCVRAFLKKRAGKISNDVVSQFRRKISAKKIQRAYREFAKSTKLTLNKKEQSDGIEDQKAKKMAALIIQKAFRSYSERKKLENYEYSSHGSVTSSPMTAIRNLSFSSELTSLENSSVHEAAMPILGNFNSTKDNDSIDGTRVVNEANSDTSIDRETIATARNVESTNDTQVDRTHGLLESKFVPDTCNSIIDQNQTCPLEQDNAVTNDLAVPTDDAVFGLVEDPTLGPVANSVGFVGGIDAIRGIVNEFLINEIQYSAQDQSQPTEVQEEPCIRKTASITNLYEGSKAEETAQSLNEQNASSDVMGEQLTPGESIDLDTFATDTLDKATLKLLKPEQTIEKMSQRQVSESLDRDNLPTEVSFEEPIIKSLGSLQEQINTDIEDGDLIIYKRLQREDTRESSAQSDSVVFGDTNDDEVERKGSAETTRVQFTRHYTIAGDDPRGMFKSVTIDETGEGDFAPLIDNTSSFCLDDETSETIRKKILAYSLSETDSDYFDPNKVITDDSYIDTAMADAMGTSTETESTIVSAATKIQAGARGFLTRRRLRRASAGTKSSTQETKASFGNDAISESLERFIEEEAAKKIQAAYRVHTRKQKRRKNKLEGASLESSLAARRQKLQRGDALRNDSTPDDDNSARTSINATNGVQAEKNSKKHRSEATAEEHRKAKTKMELKWPVMRQNSMPVQIDCEVLRVIPKHMRKRIKSAESQKKNRK